jgi:hypothetical protein
MMTRKRCRVTCLTERADGDVALYFRPDEVKLRGLEPCIEVTALEAAQFPVGTPIWITVSSE